MRIAFFDSHKFDRKAFEAAVSESGAPIAINFIGSPLTFQTARLAEGCDAVCVFVNDRIDAQTAKILAAQGVGLVALRCAGYNNVDLTACAQFSIRVVRVPAYSPHAVAEHAAGLMLALNRKIHRAYCRIREMNFSLDGLVGFDLQSKRIGLIGTGRIGSAFAGICAGFGMRIVAYDLFKSRDLVTRYGVEYVPLETLYKESDIISLHAPLTPETYHIINRQSLEMMKKGVMIINTSRGALIDTAALLDGLKSEKVGSAGLDVYEEEEGVFFEDLSQTILHDDVLARLLTLPNVIVTSHQAFLTEEALANIAATTLESIAAFASGAPLENEITA